MVRKIEEYFCEKCDTEFYNKEDAYNHENNCGVKEEFKCDKCEDIIDLSHKEYEYEYVEESCHSFDLGRMGYGSGLDGSELQFQICDDCLMKLINTFSWEAQARIHNSGSNLYGTDEQWIRLHKNEMTDEEKEELGYYSNREIEAYQERFPKCKHVTINKYIDGSSNSSCFKGSFGDENGDVYDLNPSDNCFGCKHFEERLENEDIKTVTYKEGE